MPRSRMRADQRTTSKQSTRGEPFFSIQSKLKWRLQGQGTCRAESGNLNNAPKVVYRSIEKCFKCRC